MLVQLVNDKIGNAISFQINYYPCTFFIIRFIIDMCNTFNYFFIDQYPDAVGQFITVYLVRNLCDDDLFAATWFGIYMQLAAQYNPATTGMHRRFYSIHTIDDTAGWKIRSFYMLHQFINSDLTVVDKGDTSVNNF